MHKSFRIFMADDKKYAPEGLPIISPGTMERHLAENHIPESDSRAKRRGPGNMNVLLRNEKP